MTAKEALKIIDKVHDYPCPYGIGGTAWRFIRSCIEKQIPMQAVIHGERNREVNSISYTRPVCKSHVDKCNYCSNCGQAIIFEKLKNENDVI